VATPDRCRIGYHWSCTFAWSGRFPIYSEPGLFEARGGLGALRPKPRTDHIEAAKERGVQSW